MRFCNGTHQYWCGIDLHARTMYICILDAQGQALVHKNLPATPEAFLETVEPYREGLVVAVECILTWYWLADVCAREGIAFALGKGTAELRAIPAWFTDRCWAARALWSAPHLLDEFDAVSSVRVELSFIHVAECVAPRRLVRAVVKQVRILKEVVDLSNPPFREYGRSSTERILTVLDEVPDRLAGLIVIRE